MRMTDEQRDAVISRGKVLVSASAGSGKTAVMIERLADVLEEGASLDGVLAVTFTKKAAAQMKSRLRDKLIERLESAEGDKRENIRAQLGKINSADICTIHSFCSRLVRTYFYVLGINSAFEVLTDTDAAILRSAAIDDLFARLYEEKDADLYALLSKLRKRRSDGGLRKLILEAYDEVRIRPRYGKYLGEISDETFTEEGFERVCSAYARAIGERCASLARAVEDYAENFFIGRDAEVYLAILEEMKRSLLTAVDGGLFAMPEKLFVSEKPKKYKGMPDADREADDQFMAFRNGVVKRYNDLLSGIENRDVELARFMDSGDIARAFARLLKAFDEVYDGVKREECKLDYGDLEQFALRLLTEGDGDVRRQIRERYSYVFVDEYQDVNPIQDEIITAVAGGDLFCVGDVKQAIYGFRGSRSAFFTEKRVGGEFKNYVLPDNFRSAPAIVSFVNGVFSKVMKPPVCGIDYADRQEMRVGGQPSPEWKGVAEICLYEDDASGKESAQGIYSVTEDGAKGSGYTAEGLAVLALVEEALTSTRYDRDKGCRVPVQAGDVCVLTRKNNNDRANGIIRALTSRYAVAGAAESNVCDRPEIIRLLDVLSYIDNPEQDVPLVTALLSPLGGLEERELAEIRTFGGIGKDAPPFRECVGRYAAEKEDGIAGRLNSFFATVNGLRTLSECVGAARLIDEIVGVGGFIAEYDTEIKSGALRRLQKEAYSSSGELFLGAFLTKLKESGYNVPAPSSLSEDCIKVMTMHASKGLEFPVVIIADIAASFKGDDRNEMLFSEEFGFAPRYYGEDRMYRNTLLRKLCKVQTDREELDNEINLFYVACTRAEYALHVLCSDPAEYDFVRANYAQSYADLFCVGAFPCRDISGLSVTAGSDGGRRTLSTEGADGVVFGELKELAESAYPYAEVIGLPVKDSASHIIALKDGEQFTHTLFREFEGEGAGSADRGIAYHRFLQLCDFSVKDGEGIKTELSRMVCEGLMSAGQRDLLKVDELEGILRMPAFDGIEDCECFREREFIFRVSAADYARLSAGENANFGADAGGDGVIIQGAIDLLAVRRENGRAVSASVIDYKYSDRTDEGIVRKYTPQLALYKRAVCAAYGLAPEAVGTTVINIKRRRLINIT